MSKVIYSFMQTPSEEEDEVVIDSNGLVSARLEKLQEELRRKKALEAMQPKTKIVEEPVLDEEGNPVLDEDGNQVMQEVEVEVPPEELPEEEFVPGLPELPQVDLTAEAQEQADMILADANEQAQMILNDAQEQAQAILFNAKKEGHDEGFQQGTAQAMASLEEERRNMEAELQNMAAQYRAAEESMEHDLVQTISQVLEKVFSVKFDDDQDVIYHLIDNALSNIEGSKQLQIKVNEESAAAIRERLPELQEKVGSDVQLDIIQDGLMADGECVIETDGGLFDVSLDVQLKNLMKKIRMLS